MCFSRIQKRYVVHCFYILSFCNNPIIVSLVSNEFIFENNIFYTHIYRYYVPLKFTHK